MASWEADVSDSGIAALDEMIARLDALSRPEAANRIAQRAAPAVTKAIQKTAAAGTSPEGDAWKPKKDGGRPLKNAAAHISGQALGPLISVKLEGVDVFHHRGAKGLPVRQILPDPGTIPDPVRDAVLKAAREIVEETAGGKR